MTLMSKTRHNFRRVFTCFVALLQLAVLPATYVLHVGCEHSHSDGDHDQGLITGVVSCFSGHHCSCSHHSPAHKADDESPTPGEPHDSDSCRICQAAFATSAADFFAPQLTAIGTISVLPRPKINIPASAPRYRSNSRGPPPDPAFV